MSENKENDLMMKKKTVRLISGAVAGILVDTMSRRLSRSEKLDELSSTSR